MRRILAATINYDHPQRGLLGAFQGIFGSGNVFDFDYLEMCRQGATAAEVNMRLVEISRSWKPDWIWLQAQNAEIISAEAIQEMRSVLPKAVISHWMGDMRQEVGPYLSSITKACHLTLLANRGQAELYCGIGAPRVEYLQHGLDWEEDVMGLPAWEPPFRVSDVAFCGHDYGARFPGTAAREEAILALQSAGMDVGVVGRGWPEGFPVLGECGVKEQHHVWSRAKVGINTNNFNDVELYYGDRPLIVMASGCALVTYQVRGMEREFADGFHCSFYRTREELVAKVKWLLGDAAAREKMARSGRAEAIRNHTWFSRILTALSWVEEEAARL